MIKVMKAGKMGRGIFATRNIEAGEQIDESDLLVIPNDARKTFPFFHYDFAYDDKNVAIALGRASLFNHKDKPNADWTVHKSATMPKIKVFTLKKIRKGQQIFIDYGYTPLPSKVFYEQND